MRYREGQEPDPHYPYGKSTHIAMDFSMVLGIVIGLVLLWIGIRGKILWLKLWSIGLVVIALYILGRRYLF
ncbi:MAG: hypothetical protein DWQ08_05970 [Proteobacteria bacterium]|nr:MAG: hypothetical protein DWQ08_05970 [Pseudomonadota bacterium]